MSMHNIPITDIEREGLEKHGLGRSIGKPSQLADAFRLGVRWGQDREREECAKVCDGRKQEGLSMDGCAASIRARRNA